MHVDEEVMKALTALAAAEDVVAANHLTTVLGDILGAESTDFGPLIEVLRARAAECSRWRELARLDELTRIPNRRAFNEAVERELARSARTGRSFGVILLDLDGLKPLNDQHGHAAGDEAICRTAHVLGTVVRAGDVVARLGGDEFGVLVSSATEADLHTVTRRIRDAVETQCVRSVPLRISAGVAANVGGDATREELLERADHRLYRDKKARQRLDVAA